MDSNTGITFLYQPNNQLLVQVNFIQATFFSRFPLWPGVLKNGGFIEEFKPPPNTLCRLPRVANFGNCGRVGKAHITGDEFLDPWEISGIRIIWWKPGN